MGAHDELSKLYAQETAKDGQEAHPPGDVRGRERRSADRAGQERARPGPAAHGDPEPRPDGQGEDRRRRWWRSTAPTAIAAVRKAVIEGLFLQNHAEALVSLARKESDPELKRRIVEKLSLMQGSKVGDGLPDGAAQVSARRPGIGRGDAWRES